MPINYIQHVPTEPKLGTKKKKGNANAVANVQSYMDFCRPIARHKVISYASRRSDLQRENRLMSF